MSLYKHPAYPIGIFAMVIIFIIVITTSLLLWELRKRELTHTRLETVGVTEIFAEQTARNFESADSVLKDIQERLNSSFGAQFSLDSPEVQLLLGTRVLGMRQLDAIYLMNENGQIVNSSRVPSNNDALVFDQVHVKEFLDQQNLDLRIGKPIKNKRINDWSLFISRKIQYKNGRGRGVVIAGIEISHFENFYKQLKLDHSRPVSLYRDDGVLIASYPHRESMIGEKSPELGNVIPTLHPGKIEFKSHVKSNNEKEEFSLELIPKFPLLISVTDDVEDALSNWRENAIPILLTSLMVSLFIIAAAGLLAREILHQKKLTEALGSAENRYQHTIQSVMDAIIAVDGSQNIILFNPSAERMFGMKADEMMGQPLLSLMPIRYRGSHHAYVNNFESSKIKSKTMGPQIGITGLHADGTEFPIESTISQTIIDGKVQLTAVLRDVSDRHRAEQELREINHQLRGLTDSLNTVREQERNRIARELHDDLGQQLTGIKLELSWLGNRIKDGRMPSTERIEEIFSQVDGAITSVRRLSTELRPIILEDIGLEDAIQWLANELTKKTGIAVYVNVLAASQLYNKDLEAALFRITQESLTNIARHSQASHARITLIKNQHDLVLSVSDDGAGFTLDKKLTGFGMVSMRERANALGGQFIVRSNKPNGSVIVVQFSLMLPIFNQVVT